MNMIRNLAQRTKYYWVFTLFVMFVLILFFNDQNNSMGILKKNLNSTKDDLKNGEFKWNSDTSNIIKTKCNYGENGPRVLCAIFTHKAVHKTTLPPVHNTWAKR